jgi:hypothetical protein
VGHTRHGAVDGWDEATGLELDASPEEISMLDWAIDGVLRRRIEASEEARRWRLDHLAEYRQSRSWLRHEAHLVLDRHCRAHRYPGGA